MTQWRILSSERSLQVSPIGLRLIDDLTGQAPIGRTDCILFIEDAPGQWRRTDLRPARNAGGFIIYPDLGRTGDTTVQPRHYCAEVTAEFYRPLYPSPQTGVEFDVYPYNDESPPAQGPAVHDVHLVPAPNYPFPPHLRVLRGEVRNATGVVVNAEVSRGNTERVLTDEKGNFALPLRLTKNNVSVDIDAIDHATNETGQISITLPADLGTSKTISIS
jgi:hypothetical protein